MTTIQSASQVTITRSPVVVVFNGRKRAGGEMIKFCRKFAKPETENVPPSKLLASVSG
jgi:hypothetical protein